MYALILMFWTAQGVNPSEHALVFPSIETCAKAGQSYADYEGGRERGKAEVQKTVAPRVYWFCLPVRVQGQTS
jgi:hypothetical protein